MPGWIGVIGAVVAGGVAAGTAAYIVGRSLERRVALATAAAAAREAERVLEAAKQKLALTAKEELLAGREPLEPQPAGPRGDGGRRQAAVAKKPRPPAGRAP